MIDDRIFKLTDKKDGREYVGSVDEIGALFIADGKTFNPKRLPDKDCIWQMIGRKK